MLLEKSRRKITINIMGQIPSRMNKLDSERSSHKMLNHSEIDNATAFST